MVRQAGQFAAKHYEDRASSYVNSVVHNQGDDLDVMVRAVQGAGLNVCWTLAVAGGMSAMLLRHMSGRLSPAMSRLECWLL